MFPDYWDVPATLEKVASETKRYNMEFAARLSDDEEIAQLDSFTVEKSDAADGVDLEAASDVSAAGTFSGTQVQLELSSGTAEVVYKVTCNVTGSLGTVAEGTGYLYVN